MGKISKASRKGEPRHCITFSAGRFWRRDKLRVIDGILSNTRTGRSYIANDTTVPFNKNGKRYPTYLLSETNARPIDLRLNGASPEKLKVKVIHDALHLAQERAKQRAEMGNNSSAFSNTLAKGLFVLSGGFILIMGLIWLTSGNTPLNL